MVPPDCFELKTTLCTHISTLFCSTQTSLLSSGKFILYSISLYLKRVSDNLATKQRANAGIEKYTAWKYSNSRLRISSRFLRSLLNNIRTKNLKFHTKNVCLEQICAFPDTGGAGSSRSLSLMWSRWAFTCKHSARRQLGLGFCNRSR